MDKTNVKQFLINPLFVVIKNQTQLGIKPWFNRGLQRGEKHKGNAAMIQSKLKHLVEHKGAVGPFSWNFEYAKCQNSMDWLKGKS